MAIFTTGPITTSLFVFELQPFERGLDKKTAPYQLLIMVAEVGFKIIWVQLKTKDQNHLYVMVNEAGSKPRLAEELTIEMVAEVRCTIDRTQ